MSRSDEAESSFDRLVTVAKGANELEVGGAMCAVDEPPHWFAKKFGGCANTTRNAFRIASAAAGVVVESTLRRFSSPFSRWVDKRIQRRIDEHVKDDHR